MEKVVASDFISIFEKSKNNIKPIYDNPIIQVVRSLFGSENIFIWVTRMTFLIAQF